MSSEGPLRSSQLQKRIKWTAELHGAFEAAVKELGGIEHAKPMAILNRMNVPGLTRDQVKSHLQTYVGLERIKMKFSALAEAGGTTIPTSQNAAASLEVHAAAAYGHCRWECPSEDDERHRKQARYDDVAAFSHPHIAQVCPPPGVLWSMHEGTSAPTQRPAYVSMDGQALTWMDNGGTKPPPPQMVQPAPSMEQWYGYQAPPVPMHDWLPYQPCAPVHFQPPPQQPAQQSTTLWHTNNTPDQRYYYPTQVMTRPLSPAIALGGPPHADSRSSALGPVPWSSEYARLPASVAMGMYSVSATGAARIMPDGTCCWSDHSLQWPGGDMRRSY